MTHSRQLHRLWWLFFLLFGSGCSGPAPTRILFIGNSYTFQNDMPAMFAELARAGKHDVVVDMVASGGWTLAQHVGSAETDAALKAQPWNMVVLQEQSVIPSLAERRANDMYPAIRELNRKVQAGGGQTVLFLTWGRRDGLTDAGFADFTSMQARLTEGYTTIAEELDLRVAPVGVAWQRSRAEQPRLGLWESDGSHPTRIGSYLAACVFYATLFKQSPEGLPAAPGVSAPAASYLQKLAAETVLSDQARWNMR